MNHSIQFISLGPGEPELITVKGLKALQAADCIFCPATTTPEGKQLSRAADILHSLEIPPHSLSLFELPMSKDRSKALAAYDKVYEVATGLHGKGQRVVIVAEGDAGFYSSIHYIYDKLQANGIPAECTAGIPAFIAAGAWAGLHIASQEERMIVIPGIATATELQTYLQQRIVVVIMKLSQCTDEVHTCMQLHPEHTYHYFENVGTQKAFYSCNTAELKEKRFPYFSLMIIRP